MFANILWSDPFERALLRPRRAGFPSASREIARSIERLLDVGSPWHSGTNNARTRFDMQDKGERLEFVAALPGVRMEDLELTLDKDLLTVSAQRKTSLPEGHKAHRQERSSWQFRQSFALPVPVDADSATASLKDGILRIVLPKAPAHRPRQIKIETN